MGWKPDKAGVKDPSAVHHSRLMATPIAPSSDLRAKLPPVYNQGSLGSCTGNGVACLLDYAHIMNAGAQWFTPSRLYLYYQARVMEGTINQDAGAQIRDVISGALKFGAPRESLWPYNIGRFSWDPNAKANADAANHQALKAYKLQSLDDIKRALSAGWPVVFGVPVYAEIEGLNSKNYTVPMPGKYARSIGGHCMVFVGHDEKTQMFKVRNSWGTGWGLKGHCLLPYAYAKRFEAGLDAWEIVAAE